MNQPGGYFPLVVAGLLVGSVWREASGSETAGD